MYQRAKQRILDFVDWYFDRCDFELIQMVTASNYIAISAYQPKDIARPELRAEFDTTKKWRLAWDKWCGRTSWLFKLKCEGYVRSATMSLNETAKKEVQVSTKGMSKRQNDINSLRFKAFNGSVDRMVNGQMATYEQQKLGLSPYYDKP